jgi:uncharacterized protein (DUF983 family)
MPEDQGEEDQGEEYPAEDHQAENYRAGTSALGRGLRARCPRCGVGALFERGLLLRKACGHCDLSYAFADAGDGPAVFATFILGFLILAGALLLEFKVGPPAWVHILFWGVLTPLVAFLLLRVLKATLIALQFKHKAEEWRFVRDC